MYGELCDLTTDSAADMADYLAANRTINKATNQATNMTANRTANLAANMATNVTANVTAHKATSIVQGIGKGCVRAVTILGVCFKEKIVHADDQYIEYTVVGDFPVKQHTGVITFTAHENHTQVSYRITCRAPWYLPAWLLERLLQNDVEQCLNKLGARFDPC